MKTRVASIFLPAVLLIQLFCPVFDCGAAENPKDKRNKDMEIGVWITSPDLAMHHIGASDIAGFAAAVETRLNPDWIAIKAAQGRSYMVEFTTELVTALKNADNEKKLKVYAWHYIAGEDKLGNDISEAEGVLGADLLTTGSVDGLIIVPQSTFFRHEFEPGQPHIDQGDQDIRATQYLSKFPRNIPQGKEVGYIRPFPPNEEDEDLQFTHVFDDSVTITVVMPQIFWHQTAPKYWTCDDVTTRVEVRMNALRDLQYGTTNGKWKDKKMKPIGQGATSESIHRMRNRVHLFIAQSRTKADKMNEEAEMPGPQKKLKIDALSFWSVDSFKIDDWDQVKNAHLNKPSHLGPKITEAVRTEYDVNCCPLPGRPCDIVASENESP